MKIIKKLKSIYCLSSLFILLVLIRSVFAQEVFKFFEFAPRSQEKITISKNSLEETFIPFNDFLSGLDLFINNSKVRNLDITILDKNNQVFWQKKVGIPIIDGGWWGKQYFITLGDNYQINSGDEYKLIIKGNSNDSSMDIFVKNVLEILQGTESYLYFPENLKRLKIDSKETNYTLKLALYENKETIPPVISNFRLEVINSQVAKILFNANEPITYIFKYKSNLDSTTSTFEINYFENCPYQVKDCQITLDVLAGRNYNFLFEAYDYWQNKTEKEGSFQVLGTSTESYQKENLTKQEFYSQSQTSGVDNLKQSGQSQSNFLRSLNSHQELQIKTTSDKKQTLFKKPKPTIEKITTLTEIYLEDRSSQQKEKIITEKKTEQKEEITTGKFILTSTSSEKTSSSSFVQLSKKLKLYPFIIFIFVLLFIFLFRKFKK